jgi:hypothetical protein
MADLKLSLPAAYTVISNIRQHRKIPVKFNKKDMKYYIHLGTVSPSGKKPPVKKRAYNRKPVPVSKILVDLDLPFDMPKDHAKIHPQLKGDFIDYIGQAAFFYWCAEACIRKEKLKESLSK